MHHEAVVKYISSVNEREIDIIYSYKLRFYYLFQLAPGNPGNARMLRRFMSWLLFWPFLGCFSETVAESQKLTCLKLLFSVLMRTTKVSASTLYVVPETMERTYTTALQMTLTIQSIKQTCFYSTLVVNICKSNYNM